MSDPDITLIERFSSGEREAFDEIVARYRDRLYRVAYFSLLNAHDAMDVCQEVFIRAFRVLPGWEPRAKFSTWLFKVAINLCRDYHRKAARSREVTTGDMAGHVRLRRIQSAENGAAGRSDFVNAAEKAIAKLPERQRQVFVLKHFDALKLREIAEALGCSEGSVKTHLSRALKSLRDRLQAARREATEDV